MSRYRGLQGSCLRKEEHAKKEIRTAYSVLVRKVKKKICGKSEERGLDWGGDGVAPEIDHYVTPTHTLLEAKTFPQV